MSPILGLVNHEVSSRHLRRLLSLYGVGKEIEELDEDALDLRDLVL
jgi:hypothetical protein